MPSEIEELLLRVGPSSFYGLRIIELVRGGRDWALGRFEAIGRIRLFDVPTPPWRLTRRLRSEDRLRLSRAGALLASDERGALVVSWPGTTLRDFFLLHILLHEIGHHILQHHKGKRPATIARRRDHEAFAELYAERTRRTLLEAP